MTRASYTDEYELIGEFHDLFVPPRALERLGSPLKEFFGDLPGTATVLDIGAGTGLSCQEIAKHTSAQIFAIEPSLTMRSALLARISDDPSLKHRVSVLAEPVPEVLNSMGHQIDGFVCSAMLGHLDADSRIGTHDDIARYYASPDDGQNRTEYEVRCAGVRRPTP